MVSSCVAINRSTVHRGAYFQCTAEDCGKQYKTRESISLHQKLAKHEGSELIEPGRHICDKCNKSFPSKNSLDVHNIEEHSGFPLRCSSCLESFPSFSQLKGKETIRLDLKSLEFMALLDRS